MYNTPLTLVPAFGNQESSTALHGLFVCSASYVDRIAKFATYKDGFMSNAIQTTSD